MASPDQHSRTDLPTDLTWVAWTLHRVLRQSQVTPAGERTRPPAQVELFRLVDSEPGISVREAADKLRMQANNISTLVSQLVRDDFLERRPHPQDRRIVQLYPTPKMQALGKEIDAGLRAGVAQALEQLSTPAQQRIRAAVPDLVELTRILASQTS